MSLKQCPECKGLLSSYAATCVHCGYPYRERRKPRLPRKSTRSTRTKRSHHIEIPPHDPTRFRLLKEKFSDSRDEHDWSRSSAFMLAEMCIVARTNVIVAELNIDDSPGDFYNWEDVGDAILSVMRCLRKWGESAVVSDLLCDCAGSAKKAFAEHCNVENQELSEVPEAGETNMKAYWAYKHPTPDATYRKNILRILRLLRPDFTDELKELLCEMRAEI